MLLFDTALKPRFEILQVSILKRNRNYRREGNFMIRNDLWQIHVYCICVNRLEVMRVEYEGENGVVNRDYIWKRWGNIRTLINSCNI